ncbi:hypothetical protein G7Y89_g10402 [Cudoniella acicularis]|uniref:Calcineurin-like phosphoesterase domain-containing protein n=1 Tax=Cudoniella acicularis TaxID=354080 RepID=A0A8H4REE2_9HELO|nr:hypothetical protein G7Y89_g10402 [Cudoniella acicularis]
MKFTTLLATTSTVSAAPIAAPNPAAIAKPLAISSTQARNVYTEAERRQTVPGKEVRATSHGRDSVKFTLYLHLEAPKSYDVFKVVPSAPYLALIGDIDCVKDSEFCEFTTKLSKFKIVFLVLKNHDSYHSNWTSTKENILDFEKENREKNTAGNLGSFIFLDQTRFDLSDEITILGCTLFSSILPPQVEMAGFGLKDFYHTEDWTVERHSQAHKADLERLNTQVKSISEPEPHRKIIIFTHHSPTVSSLATDPVNANSQVSSRFSSDLSEICWTSLNVRVWAYGHTHFNCDFLDPGNGKRAVTNQSGYYFKQSEGFDETKTIEI